METTRCAGTLPLGYADKNVGRCSLVNNCHGRVIIKGFENYKIISLTLPEKPTEARIAELSVRVTCFQEKDYLKGVPIIEH